MNLHGIVAGVIAAVNPLVMGEVLQSTGYATGANFKQAPSYAPAIVTAMQVQALTTPQLEHMDSLNIQGNFRRVYLNGDWNGIIRASGAGGDMLAFGGFMWKVVEVTEQFPDWTCVTVCLQ